jgi:signal transduction histidine kinase
VSNNLDMDGEEFLLSTISILAAAPESGVALEKLEKLSCLANACLSDWCAVFTLEKDAGLRRLLPSGGPYPLDTPAAAGPGHAIRSGEMQFLKPVSDEVLAELGLPPGEPSVERERRPSSCLCLPLTARGRTLGAMAFLSDGRKGDLSAGNFRLARAVAQAAAVALDNAELWRDAQEANRLKDEFIAVVSHELRTPLTPMLGGIHLLRTARLSESNLDRALDIIERNAQTQLRIVEDLLDASRIVAGKLRLYTKSVQLTPILETALDSIRSSAGDKGIHIITALQDCQLPVEGDSHRIQQIMWHLLSNAVKFTPSGGRIDVSMKPE